MAERRDGGRQGDSGTAGGTDVEPLRGGMAEVSRGDPGERETSARKDPAAPYHDSAAPEGGLVPRGAQGGGSAPPQRAPDKGRNEVQREAGGKIGQERGDQENEAGNAPREDPGAPGAGERR
jgi:hypothetical protein